MFTLQDGYAIPIFADGTVRFIVEKNGERVFAVAHAVRGAEREAQEADIAAARANVQEFVDLANAGAAAR